MINAVPRAWVCFLVCLFSAGCQSLRGLHPPVPFGEQPAEPANTIRANQFVFHTDLDLKKEQELLQELGELPEQVFKELHLPPSTTLIHVYLFKDADRYHDYLNYRYQEQKLPDRRAF